MAMNLVQQGEDLQDFSDEALANELQTGQRGYLPVAVISEIERRTRDRQRYQQTMAAQQAEAPPVVEARLMEFMAQSQPSPEMGMAPEMAGMPPEMAAMPPQGIMAAQPEMAPMPAEAPAGIASMMPPQQMAEGGMVRRAQAGDPLRMSPNQREIERILRKGPAARTPEENEILRAAGRTLTQRTQDPMGSIASLEATFASPFIRRGITEGAYLLSDEDLASAGDRPGAVNERIYRALGGRQYTQPSAASQATAAPAAPASGEFSLPAARDVSIFSDLRPGTDYSGGTQEREELLGLESFTPSISNFQDVYSRELADRLLKPVTIQSQRATPESVAAASEAARTGFYPQEMERLRKFAPDREKFDKSRQSDLLVGLGSVIAGATQRGDIAKGLAQLAAQQREAQREFRREEREYMGLESALRREQRQEERADVRESRAERRADEAIERAEELSARTQAANIAQQVVSGEKDLAELRRDMMLIDIKQQEAQRALAAAVTKEQREQAEMALRNLKTYAEMLKMAIESAGTPGVTQPALFRRLLESGDSMTSASELQSLGR
jgi:hypothetical protein